MTRKHELSISLLDCPSDELIKTVKELNTFKGISLHLDVIDTSYCANISFSLKILDEILKETEVPTDIHFMVGLSNNSKEIIFKYLFNPKVRNIYLQIKEEEEYVKFYNEIIFEIENIKDLDFSRLENITDFSIIKDKIGFAINPHFNIKRLQALNSEKLKILQMTVTAGKGGQKFLYKKEEIQKRLKELKNLNKKVLGVDGGINLENMEKVRGVDFLVVGSAFFKENSKKDFINSYNKIMNEK